MELMGCVKDYLTKELRRFTEELAEKYGVPAHEIEGDVSEFLEDKYGPAKRLAVMIFRTNQPSILFIGQENCTICRRCRPELETFLMRHKDMQFFKIDYSEPEGLLYHMTQPGDGGLLPMIALIFEGSIRMVYTGECVLPDVYENYYINLKSEYSPKCICPQKTLATRRGRT